MKQEYIKILIDIIIFILMLLILKFNLVSSNIYLKNLMFIIVIGYFGLVDLKFSLILFIIYILDFEYKKSIYLDNLYNENFIDYKSILNRVHDSVKKNEFYKTLKKNIKSKGRELFKSIQEEDIEVLPEKKDNKSDQDENEEDSDSDEEQEEEKKEEKNKDEENEEETNTKNNKKIIKKKIETFTNKNNKETNEDFNINEDFKKNIENNYLFKQLKKNDILDKNLEGFQGSIETKLEKINNLLKKLKKDKN